jgi:nucleoside-diphosphate-sugar epimerase
MRIFVAGATGALGSRLVPILVKNGHAVTGTTRSQAKRGLIRARGAEPVVMNGLDRNSVMTAVTAARPDVIVHQMTDLAGAIDMRHFDRSFAVSNRLRTEGADLLLLAARAASTRRIVVQSYCGWPYARTGDAIKSEDAPLDHHPPQEMGGTLDAIRYLENLVCGSDAPEGVVLRYGTFYGPGTGMFDDAMVGQVRHRRMPVIGGGGGIWSFVHIDDAARATAQAIDHGKPGNLYNIVDDDPAPVREWLPELAALLGAKRPFHVPALLARLFAGEHIVTMMTNIRGCSNAKAKRELGWQPEFASWRVGFADVVRRLDEERRAA